MRINLRAVLLLFVLSGFLVLPVLAQAQQVGFSLTKSLFDIEVFAGGSYKGSLTVFNNPGSVVTPVHIQLSLWGIKEDSDDIEFITAEPALNATKWFVLQNGSDFILAPDDARDIDFRIEVPKEVTPGSYLVMMRFQAVLPEHYFVQEGPRLFPEIGALFFIRVPLLSLEGSFSGYAAVIDSFEPAEEEGRIPLLASLLPRAEAGVFEDIVEKLTAEVTNKGVFHFKASGYVDIQNIFGKSIARAELPGRFLLPNRTRSIDIEVAADDSFLVRNFRIGMYSATMVLNVPGSDVPLIEIITFWIFPWKVILTALWIAGIFFFLRKRIWAAGKVLLGIHK